MAEGRSALVTGGAGFIGSHLVDRLLDGGFRVVIVDDLSSGKLKNVNQHATFHHMSINRPSLLDVFTREKPDLVFHMAAQSSVSRSTRDPILDSEINVLGTLRLLEAARRVGVDKIIYSCTGGALYGEPVEVPCHDDAPVVPISPYGMSKFVAEQYLEYYRRQYLINYTSLRYGNVYGPRQDPDGEAGVIAIFISAMLNGKRPVIYGDGDQERDFIAVGDVIEANLACHQSGQWQVHEHRDRGTDHRQPDLRDSEGNNRLPLGSGTCSGQGWRCLSYKPGQFPGIGTARLGPFHVVGRGAYSTVEFMKGNIMAGAR